MNDTIIRLYVLGGHWAMLREGGTQYQAKENLHIWYFAKYFIAFSLEIIAIESYWIVILKHCRGCKNKPIS